MQRIEVKSNDSVHVMEGRKKVYSRTDEWKNRKIMYDHLHAFNKINDIPDMNARKCYVEI